VNVRQAYPAAEPDRRPIVVLYLHPVVIAPHHAAVPPLLGVMAAEQEQALEDPTLEIEIETWIATAAEEAELETETSIPTHLALALDLDLLAPPAAAAAAATAIVLAPALAAIHLALTPRLDEELRRLEEAIREVVVEVEVGGEDAARVIAVTVATVAGVGVGVVGADMDAGGSGVFGMIVS
jgi:hypothetical protein